MPARRPLYAAAAATLAVAAARFFPLSPLLDAVTGAAPAGARLVFPASHVLLTPLTTLGDGAACSGARQAVSLVCWLLALYVPLAWAVPRLRGWKGALAWPFVCAAALAWGVLYPRAPARIVVEDGGLMAVDFHSHTTASWDGRFTRARSLKWHESAGFDAAFITDHNTISSEPGGLRGEELSLHDAHVLLLGPKSSVDPKGYPGLDGLRAFLREAGPVHGGLAVPSLPEYYKHHRERLEDLAASGAAGFEIVAASPKGLDAPPSFRRSVIELCRRRNLFLTGGTDQHGYGTASCVWSLVKVPGWRALPPERHEAAVMAALRGGGFGAVAVAARARALRQPETAADAWLDAPRAAWDAARSWTAAQALAFLVWLWGAAFCGAAANKVH